MSFQKELTQALRNGGDNIAIEQGNNFISYTELLSRANQITRFILDQRIGKGAYIGILLKDRIDQIASIIGIANAGAVFIPIDASLPEKRLQEIQKNLGLTYVIDSRKVNRSIGLTPWYIEDIKASESEREIDYPEGAADDSLYVYFTSGSTGRPKGIIGRNASLLQFIRWEIKAFGIENSIRVSQFITPYFDAFLRDVFVPLFAGGTICIPPMDEDFFSPEKMINWIDNKRINLIHCVPSVFRIFNSQDLSYSHFRNLQYVLLSGEKIIPTELAPWYQIFGDRIQLVNLYGTTETTMIRASYNIQPTDAKKNRIPIGGPIDDTELLILNKDLKPCNTLITGDLYIASDFMTKGYLNDPELTKAKFVTFSRGEFAGKTAFRTGDKARRLPGGIIELLGREDRQVKINGIRVELDEIENILMRSGRLTNAIAIVHAAEGEQNESLIAFVCPNEENRGREELENELQFFAQAFLPTYMMPSTIIEVAEFPLLNNGKIDFKGLIKLLAGPKDQIIAPVNETEEAILEIWKGILGDKPISTQENFTRLGGNSLAMMRLIAKIFKTFNIRIPLHELFKNLTIASQAALIRSLTKDDSMAISKAPAKEAYCLSAAQERIYFNYELDKNSTAYNLPIAWEIVGDLDIEKLNAILQNIIRRHESLRTIFRFDGKRHVQIIRDEVDFQIEQIDASDKEAQQAITDFIRPFDLGEAPLLRCAIIHAAAGRRYLALDTHHIVCDGISQINIFRDFIRSYRGEELAALDLQYKDYAEWESKLRVSEEYMSLREFWLKSFEGDIPKLTFPVAEEEIADGKGGTYNIQIERDVYASLFETLKEEEVTKFSGLFSLFSLFLYYLTGQEDMVIGINTSGRVHDEMQDTVGMFAKTLPIRCQADTKINFRSLSRRIHKQLVEANGKQLYDLADIISELNKKRSNPIKELFNVMFVFQNFDSEDIRSAGGPLVDAKFENTTFKYPITLFVREEETALNFRFEYATQYFSREDIKIVAAEMQALIELIAKNTDANIIELLAEESQEETLSDDGAFTFNF
ncbi:MAG: amino acid adenylation domain-containing protein [Bacteroidota bacterium]